MQRSEAVIRGMRAALVAGAVVALGVGCAPVVEEQPFDAWADEMRAALSVGLGSPSAGGASGTSVQLDLGLAGDYSVAAACRGADAATIALSSSSTHVADLDVVCGTSAPVVLTLPSADALMTVDDDVDWYVVFNRSDD